MNIKYAICFLKCLSKAFAYWIRVKILRQPKSYLYNSHLIPIIERINDEKIFHDGGCSFMEAIHRDAFKNGIIERFLRPNNYLLNAKDIAIAFNISVAGYSRDTFISRNVIDASIFIAQTLRGRLMLDGNFEEFLQGIGKNPKLMALEVDRSE